MSDITLSKAVRANLQSLRNTASMMAQTQNTLATGKKVNSALDNPSNFFTASSLNARAGDMNALMDGMANGIQTLEAADNGLKAITKTLESMQSTLRQARQDKSFETASYSLDAADIDTSTVNQLSFSGGAVGETAVTVDLNTADVAATDATLAGSTAVADDTALQAFDTESITLTAENGDEVSFDITGTSTKTELTTALSDAGFSATFNASDELELTRSDGVNFTAAGAGATSLGIASTSTDGVEATTGEVQTVDQLVSTINSDTGLKGKIRASNDNGNLRIENLSTQDLDIDGAGSDGTIDGTSSGAASIDGNSVRADLATQYNELRDQLDKLADDASFNGVNLLRGDNLQITFNETGTSELNIQTKEGETINSANLGIRTELSAEQLDSDDAIDGFLSEVKTAVNSVRAQSSAFGSSLSIVQNRQDFTSNMMNTLETGAANLTLADSNEEAANLLALQTRQQLSSTALSMASQQDQSVLRLF